MKIAIHKGTSWNLKWIQYCEEKKLNHIVVDCYDSDIIEQLKKHNVSHLMWHFKHASSTDLLMARNVLYSANKMDIKTFPNFDTCWHFDDKVSQKYLLESIQAPVVKSWVFYNLNEAIDWVKKDAEYPIVAKLRRGAGSYNVILLKNSSQAIKYIRKLFSKGINPSPKYLIDVNTRVSNVLKRDKNEIWKKALNTPQRIIKTLSSRQTFNNEKGYVYFQEFLPNNTHDLRIVIIKDKAFGFYRTVRKNDFRASGSGSIDYEMTIPQEIIKISFNTAQSLNAQSVAFDYVKDRTGNYKIVEISYGYVSDAIYKCHGYWDVSLDFHEGHFYPEEIILDNLIK